MYTRKQAVARSLATKTNVPGKCQKTTRGWLGAPSAGDVDHDGDADAMDGWKSEPTARRHSDRHPPAGVPVAYSGGSHGYGHRALSLGNGMIRSTDAGGMGKVATVPLDWPEKHWGLTYLGWSETMDGILIPEDPKPAPKPTAGKLPDAAADALRKAKANAKTPGRKSWIARALRIITGHQKAPK